MGDTAIRVSTRVVDVLVDDFANCIVIVVNSERTLHHMLHKNGTSAGNLNREQCDGAHGTVESSLVDDGNRVAGNELVVAGVDERVHSCSVV